MQPVPCNGTMHPFTVIWWVDASVEVSRVWANDPNDAISRAGFDYFGEEYWDQDEFQLFCVLYGHNEMCMVEHSDNFRWFK